MKKFKVGQICDYTTMDVLTGKIVTIKVRIEFTSPGFYNTSSGQNVYQIPMDSTRLKGTRDDRNHD